MDVAPLCNQSLLTVNSLREAAKQLERAINVTFKGWQVDSRLCEHLWTSESALERASPRQQQFPLGAFEVSLSWKGPGGVRRVAVLHSKLKSRRFPDTFGMLSSVVKLVGAHAEKLREGEGSCGLSLG